MTKIRNVLIELVEEDYSEIKKGARLLGLSIRDFVGEAALERAVKVITDAKKGKLKK